MFAKTLKLNYFASEKNSLGNPMDLAWDGEITRNMVKPLNFHQFFIQQFYQIVYCKNFHRKWDDFPNKCVIYYITH